MRLISCVLVAFTLAAPAYAGSAPGSLTCVIYDRAFRMNLNGTYFYGITDTLATLDGSVEILWEATPKPLRQFNLDMPAVSRIAMTNSDLTLELTKATVDGRPAVQAHILVTGKRAPKDRTTFRGAYRLEIGRVMPVTTATKSAGKNETLPTPNIRPLHAVNGYAECTAN